jgi:ATP phosphoribosyltransferase regulatory subunit
MGRMTGTFDVTTGPRPLAERIVARFAAAGYHRTEPPVLQPADVFLDLSGEDIRSRMFVTADADGREWALRPEYTIPVARAYLASPEAGRPATLSYCGPVFRLRAGESGEFIQAGIESYGRRDAEAADAEVLALALEAATEGGLTHPEIRLGDVGLFTALLDALALPPARVRALRRAFAAGKLDGAAIDALSGPEAEANEHAGLLRTLSGQDPKAAHAFVQDLLSIAGISSVGGRSAGEIAERFLARAAEADTGIPGDARDVLRRFIAVSGDPDTASARLRAIADDAGLDLARVLDAFDARTGFIAARGVDVSALAFSAGFGRNLDYYTGAVFEVRDPQRPERRPVVGGGRYDRLLKTLGAAADLPAVGCSIWLDRLPGAEA